MPTLVNKYLPQDRKFSYKETLLNFLLFLYSILHGALLKQAYEFHLIIPLDASYFTMHIAIMSEKISDITQLSFPRILWNSGIVSITYLFRQVFNAHGDDVSSHVVAQVRKMVVRLTVDCL